MTDDILYDGAPLEILSQLSPPAQMEAELEPEILPLGVRPFDPATYHPRTHVLPPGGGLSLLQGLRSHVSEDGYLKLPTGVRYILDEAGLSLFCTGLSRHIAMRPLLDTLVERWWDTTNFFHFSTAREMTMTPHDFSMLIGVGVGVDPIPYDMDMVEWEAAWLHLLGARPPLFSPAMVRYSWFAEHFQGREP
ncbi:hypothetical protein ACSBR2_015880 [Camellia fascicularis]